MNKTLMLLSIFGDIVISFVTGLILLLMLNSSTVEAPISNISPPVFEDRILIEQEETTPEISLEELLLLARIISAEARGESLEGQIAVGNVVLNRVEASWYPNTIQEVIYQPGQFCPVTNGNINQEPAESALIAAELVLSGQRIVSKQVLFFYNHNIVTNSHWIRSRAIETIIGNHTFAR